MNLIMNEYELAEKLLSDRDLGADPIGSLSCVSRYYRANKYSSEEIRGMLDVFLLQCYPDASLVKWSDTLDHIVKKSAKRPIVAIDYIPITHSELDKINSLEGIQLRRLAFTVLCVAKYWDRVNGDNGHWVNNSDRELMVMANISTSLRRQSHMLCELRDAGLIRSSKKIDVTNVQVLFCDDDGAPAVEIRDLRNIGYQYMKMYYPGYYVCEHCGITSKQPEGHRGRPRKYCVSCAQEVRTQQNVNAVMRHRERIRAQ